MQIEVEGVKEMRRAIRLFAPDLSKALDKELRRVLTPIVRKAKGFVPTQSPMSGWSARSFSEAKFPPFVASTIKSGIGLSTKPGRTNSKGFTSNARIFNNSVAGAIYETAGRVPPGTGQRWGGPKAPGTGKGVSRSSNPGAGAQFISQLPELTSSLKGRGRLIFKAWSEDNGKAYSAAFSAINATEKEFMARTKTHRMSRAA